MGDSKGSIKRSEWGSVILKILFIVLASNTIGYGHLNRCGSLSDEKRLSEHIKKWIILGDSSTQKLRELPAEQVSNYPTDDFASFSIDKMKSCMSGADVIVTDIVHEALMNQREAAQNLFQAVRASAKIWVAIDSVGAQSMGAQKLAEDTDILVIPYLTDDPEPGSLKGKLLRGPEYALLAPSYRGGVDREHRPNANRIMVSCGGSDPAECSLVVLVALNKIKTPLEVRLVVGPLFSDSLKAKIAKELASYRHKYSTIVSPPHLRNEMLWCDMAITTTGLVKYELAATQTPAVVFSIDPLHDSLNGPFAAGGSVVDLGVSPDVERIATETERLLGSLPQREALAVAGAKIVDGKGAERVAAKIVETMAC
jgi:spore coat polysaccharide biosynthesis predicted glycosyltransferase SpsG